MKSKYFYPIVVIIIAFAFGGGTALGSALMERTGATTLQSAFSYQGYIEDGSGAITDTCDLEFKLWDDPSIGTQIGSTVTKAGVSVSEGLFSVQLDFGAAAFEGDDRYLEIGIKCTGDSSFTTLSPRQPITPVPYAMFAMDTVQLENVINVAKSGGDFTSIQAAIDHAVTNGADVGNPYIIYIAPGDYYEQVTMARYVDLQGAGVNQTTITWHGSNTPNEGTIIGAWNTVVKDLKIINEGAGYDYSIGVYNLDVNPGSYIHTDINAQDGALETYGMLNTGEFSRVSLEYITINAGNSPIVRSVFYKDGASGDISHAEIGGWSDLASSDVIGIGLTQIGNDMWFESLFVGANASGTSSNATGIWLNDNTNNLYISGLDNITDGTTTSNGIHLDNSKIIMTNSKTHAFATDAVAKAINGMNCAMEVSNSQVFADGSTAYGAFINECNTTLMGIQIQVIAEGPGGAYGLYNEGLSNIRLSNVNNWTECTTDCPAIGIWNQGSNSFNVKGGYTKVAGSGGTSYGMKLDSIFARIFEGEISASGGTSYGISAADSLGSCEIYIYNSFVGWSTKSIEASGPSTHLYIANSMIASDFLTDGSAHFYCIQNFTGTNTSVSCP